MLRNVLNKRVSVICPIILAFIILSLFVLIKLGPSPSFAAISPNVEILNPIAPTYKDVNDSDDFFVKGAWPGNEDLNKMNIYYNILAPQDPTKVHLKIKTEDGKNVTTIVTDKATVGINLFTWDGKNAEGKFVEDWSFTAQIEAYFAKSIEVSSSANLLGSAIIRSKIHPMIELSGRHKPIIFLHQTEYSSPVDFDDVPVDWLNAWLPVEAPPRTFWEKCPGTTTLGKASEVIKAGYDHKLYYMDFNDNKLKKQGAHKVVYARGKVVDDLAFVQYWMFYPSSTPGTDNAKHPKTKVYHEGDWEMMQVAIKIDTENKTLRPEGATASQHYAGQTLLWADLQAANKYSPVIYIAAGSHATYFTSDTFLLFIFRGTLPPPLPPLPIEIRISDYTDKPQRNPERYILKPFGPLPTTTIKWWLWKGRWGKWKRTPRRDYWARFVGIGEESSSGPRSPKYRGTAVDVEQDENAIWIFDQPKEFYEKYK